MLRISNLIKSSIENTKERSLDGSIAIWNMTNRCNLSCMHCYSKAELQGSDALSLEDITNALNELAKGGVRFLIISGGEPLARDDIFDIANICKKLGIITSLSTNGLYIHTHNIEKIVATFDYIGISIDGRESAHDNFRQLKGSFKLSLSALKLLLKHTDRVGIRFTITNETLPDLGYIFELAEELKIPKIYISHLVYSGRGYDNLKMDVSPKQRCEAVEYILDKAFEYYDNSTGIDIVTGNMEMDGVALAKRFLSDRREHYDNLIIRLKQWGGNSAGKKLVNIDSNGNVKPDPFSHITLGNIKERSFNEIWNDDSDILNFLRTKPRELGGKCGDCNYLDMCNGGSRARAWAISGDIRAQDPSCYIEEILK